MMTQNVFEFANEFFSPLLESGTVLAPIDSLRFLFSLEAANSNTYCH